MTNVLLIEDDPWQADMASDQLTAARMSVTVARDAIAAIHEVDEHLPDIIVLDLFLPGPNGLAFLHELRSFTDTGAIPVVLWTASASKSDLEQFASYGVVSIVDKTNSSVDELVATVRKALKA